MSEITPNTPNPVREDAYVEELSEKLGIDPQYIPKSPVWRNEEEIKAIAEMFANMQGGGGVLVVNLDIQTRTLDKTYKEIADAGFAVLHLPDSEAEANYYTMVLDHFGQYDDGGTTMYSVEFWVHGMNTMYFETNSENGYPVFAE